MQTSVCVTKFILLLQNVTRVLDDTTFGSYRNITVSGFIDNIFETGWTSISSPHTDLWPYQWML